MPPDPVADPVAPVATRSTRLVRQASLTSAIAAVAVVGIALGAMTIARAPATPAPAGAAGLTEAPRSNEVASTAVESTASLEPGRSTDGSPIVSSAPIPSADATPWRTSPPSTCNPYVKPCDPTVPPVWDYVSVIVMTNGSTESTIGHGRVTFVAGSHTYTCTWTMRPPDCYWDVPPGTPVVATAYPAADSFCYAFALIWEDHTRLDPPACSPISFTMTTQKAQLDVIFDLIPAPTPGMPTDPPATEPPATPDLTPESTPASS